MEAAIDKIAGQWDTYRPAIEKRFSELLTGTKTSLIAAEEFKVFALSFKVTRLFQLLIVPSRSRLVCAVESEAAGTHSQRGANGGQ